MQKQARAIALSLIAFAVLAAIVAGTYLQVANQGQGPEPSLDAVLAQYVTPEVAAHFDTFDANADSSIDRTEAAAFYAWVEANIVYRYDNEDQENPSAGFVVGDGRPGRHYQQTPVETLSERYGDCEDMNTLQVAFFNYFGVAAYQGRVNARADSAGVDHAIAIVYAGNNTDAFYDAWPDTHFYYLEETAPYDVPAGYYVVVDNAYSDEFGRISNGADPGAFMLHDLRGLGGLYDVVID